MIIVIVSCLHLAVIVLKSPKSLVYLSLLLTVGVYVAARILWGMPISDRVFLTASRTYLFGGKTSKTLLCTNGTFFYDDTQGSARPLVSIFSLASFVMGKGRISEENQYTVEYAGQISKDDLNGLRTQLGDSFDFSGTISPPGVFDADEDVAMKNESGLATKTIKMNDYNKYESLLNDAVAHGRPVGYKLTFNQSQKISAWPFTAQLDVRNFIENHPPENHEILLENLDKTVRATLEGYFQTHAEATLDFYYLDDPSVIYGVTYHIARPKTADFLGQKESLEVYAAKPQSIEKLADSAGLMMKEVDEAIGLSTNSQYTIKTKTRQSGDDLKMINSDGSSGDFVRTVDGIPTHEVFINVERLTQPVNRVDCRTRAWFTPI